MPFIPIPNTAMVELRYTHMLQKMENTIYFDFGTDPDEAAMTALGEALIDWWVERYAPFASQGVVLHEVFLTDLTSDTSPAVSVLPATLAAGEDTTDPMPGNVTLSVKFSTSGRGRSSRGRNYSVGACEDHVFGNTFSGTYVAGIVGAYNNLLSVAAGAGVTWVVASRFTNNAPRTTGLAIPITTVAAVDSDVDSQRRRLSGRGT